MAIYHFNAKIVQRSKGQSAVAKSAYISRTCLVDENTGSRHDYRNKGEALFSDILIPANCPEWLANLASNRQRFWSVIERVEKRCDAQLAREIEVALPHELNAQERLILLEKFVQENFINNGMVADVAIHPPSPEGDRRNVHAHILLTMRSIDCNGFGKKMRDWNSKSKFQAWRRQWAKLVNRHLERQQINEVVDHRSLRSQGVDREPTIHFGPVVTILERRGVSTIIGNKVRAISLRNRLREAICVRKEIKVMNREQSLNNLSRKSQNLADFLLTALQHCHSEIVPNLLLTGEKKYWSQQLAALRRRVALDNIKRDLSIGRHLNAQDLHKLNFDDLRGVSLHGCEYLHLLCEQGENQHIMVNERQVGRVF